MDHAKWPGASARRRFYRVGVLKNPAQRHFKATTKLNYTRNAPQSPGICSQTGNHSLSRNEKIWKGTTCTSRFCSESASRPPRDQECELRQLVHFRVWLVGRASYTVHSDRKLETQANRASITDVNLDWHVQDDSKELQYTGWRVCHDMSLSNYWTVLNGPQWR